MSKDMKTSNNKFAEKRIIAAALAGTIAVSSICGGFALTNAHKSVNTPAAVTEVNDIEAGNPNWVSPEADNADVNDSEYAEWLISDAHASAASAENAKGVKGAMRKLAEIMGLDNSAAEPVANVNTAAESAAKAAGTAANAASTEAKASNNSAASASGSAAKSSNSTAPAAPKANTASEYSTPSKAEALNAAADINGTPYSFDDLTGSELTGTAFNYDEARAKYGNVIPERVNGVSAEKKLTVMLYICGTDLESRDSEAEGYFSACASNDIYNMIRSQYDLSKVNVLVCAGGTNRWANDYMKDKNNDLKCSIYAVNPEAFAPRDKSDVRPFEKISEKELPCLASFDNGKATNMGNAQLFAGFVEFATKYFPAENYGMIINNHGAGVTGGVCTPDADKNNEKGKSLMPYDIEAALRNTTEFGANTDKRMAFITMDACLMGSAEIAANLAPYCNYYIGCSEIEMGSLNYNELMKRISAECKNDGFDSKKVAGMFVESSISDAAANDAINSHRGNTHIVGDIVAFDSNGAYALSQEINTLSEKLMALKDNNECAKLWDNCLASIENAALRADGLGAGNSITSSYEYVDGLGFLKLLQSGLENNSGSLNAAEKKALAEINAQFDKIYNTRFMTAGGVGINGEMAFKLDENSKNNYSFNDVLKSGKFNEGSWKAYKGSINGGVSLYVPRIYYFAGSDTKISASDNSEKYNAQNIIPAFTSLMKEYVSHQSTGKAAEDREALTNNIKYTAAVMPVEGTNAEVLLERFYTKGADGKDYTDYIKVKFNDTAAFDQNGTQTQFSYNDVAKTVDSLKLYVEKYQDVKVAGTDEAKSVKLVVGEVNVAMTDMSGAQNALNIKCDTIANALAVKVFGTAVNEKNSVNAAASDSMSVVVDWARVSSDAANCGASELRLTGCAVKYNSETAQFERGQECVLVFTKQGYDDSNDYRFTVAETVKTDANENSEAVDTDYITFTHYYVNEAVGEDGTVSRTVEKLEDAAQFDWTAPIFSVKDENGNINSANIKVSKDGFCTKECETTNSYDLEFNSLAGKKELVALPTAQEKANMSPTGDEVWTVAPDEFVLPDAAPAAGAQTKSVPAEAEAKSVPAEAAEVVAPVEATEVVEVVAPVEAVEASEVSVPVETVEVAAPVEAAEAAPAQEASVECAAEECTSQDCASEEYEAA